jgi:hypothetical protein
VAGAFGHLPFFEIFGKKLLTGVCNYDNLIELSKMTETSNEIARKKLKKLLTSDVTYDNI